jgi:hypothetical protein
VSNLVRGTVVAFAITAVCALSAGPAVAHKAGSPPKNELKPSLPKAAEDGQVLTVDEGKWASAGPVTYAFDWQRCGGGACVAIAGAEQQSYRVQTADIGDKIRVIVTATNEFGSKKAKSNKTQKTLPGPPVNLELPTISGTVLPGETLTANNGTWAGTPPITFHYQWRDCEPLGGLCHDIVGATEQKYTIQPTEVGDGFVVIVRGVNAYGEEPATSPEVTPGAPGI